VEHEPRPFGSLLLVAPVAALVAVVLYESGSKNFGKSGQCEAIFCFSHDTNSEQTRYVYRGSNTTARTETTYYCADHAERGLKFAGRGLLGWGLAVGSWLIGWIAILAFLVMLKECIVPSPKKPEPEKPDA